MVIERTGYTWVGGELQLTEHLPETVQTAMVGNRPGDVVSGDRSRQPFHYRIRPALFDRVPTDGTEWCGVDEKFYEDGPVWSPSVCTSDSGIEAKSESDAVNILLERHQFEWPQTIDGWKLRSVRREVVMDDEPRR